MKILRIYIKIPPKGGGMENHILTLSQYQRRQGHEVTIFYNQGRKSHVDDRRILYNLKLHLLRPQFLGFFIFHLGVLLLKNKDKYEIIHLHGDWSSFIFGYFYKVKFQPSRLVFSLHGSLAQTSKLKKKILLFLLRKADVVYSTGYETYELVKPFCNAYFQPSGVDDFFYSTSEKKKSLNEIKIITVANLVPAKNIFTILEISRLLKSISFYVIGDGAQRKQIEDIINERQIVNVFLLGFKEKKTIPTFLADADIFLFTSILEGTPTAVLEAMAVGLPIVTSDVGGISSVMSHGENGYIVPSLDVEEYVNCIELLLDNNKMYDEISQNNISKSYQFSWTIVSKRITKLMVNG